MVKECWRLRFRVCGVNEMSKRIVDLGSETL